jgi:uncharacterized cupredoxin-like copper-binding protein
VAAQVNPSTVTIHGGEFYFSTDTPTVPAGQVHFVFINDSQNFNHEVWVYPQDQPNLRALLTQKRAGNDVDENDYLQGVVGEVVDVAPGDTASFDGVLTPGIYEMACFINETIGGQTMNHYDSGMHALLTVQ